MHDDPYLRVALYPDESNDTVLRTRIEARSGCFGGGCDAYFNKSELVDGFISNMLQYPIPGNNVPELAAGIRDHRDTSKIRRNTVSVRLDPFGSKGLVRVSAFLSNVEDNVYPERHKCEVTVNFATNYADIYTFASLLKGVLQNSGGEGVLRGFL